MKKKYFILLILTLIFFCICISLNRNKKDFNIANSQISNYNSSYENIIYNVSNYYIVDNNSLIELKEKIDSADLIINTTVINNHNEYEILISYEWLKRVKIKSYALAFIFSPSINSYESSISRNTYTRKNIQSEWELIATNTNRCTISEPNKYYIWSNLINYKQLYNKKDIFKIKFSEEIPNEFFIQFAYSKNDDITPNFNINTNKMEFKNNKDINTIDITCRLDEYKN